MRDQKRGNCSAGQTLRSVSGARWAASAVGRTEARLPRGASVLREWFLDFPEAYRGVFSPPSMVPVIQLPGNVSTTWKGRERTKKTNVRLVTFLAFTF